MTANNIVTPSTGFTDLLKTNILINYFKSAVGTTPKSLYVGLFVSTGQPTDVPTELVIGSMNYSRVLAIFNNDPVNNTISNTNDITWPTATGDWTTGTNVISHIGIFNSNVAGTVNPYEGLLVYLPLSKNETVLEGGTFVLNAGSIKLSLV